MFKGYLFYYTNTTEDFKSDVTSECTQYILSEGYAGVKTRYINKDEIACLLHCKEEK